VRRTYILVDGELVEKSRARPSGHYVIPDLPDYESPVDGSVVHGRRGRRYDLARTGCRPYEGREQEEREAGRHRQYDDQKFDRKLDESVGRAYAQMHPDKRRLLRG